MTESQKNLINSEMRRLSVGGGVTGADAEAIFAAKSVRTIDINTLKDGDVFSLPTTIEEFGAQIVRGNEAPYFMAMVSRDGKDVAVPVYLSQLTRSYPKMENDDFVKEDGENLRHTTSGPLCDIATQCVDYLELRDALIEKGKSRGVKKIKVTKTLVDVMAYDFKNEVWKPKKDQALYNFEWA